MITVTPNDVRALAVSGLDHPVLALINGAVELLPAADVPTDTQIIFTRAQLNRALGNEVADVEAELLAGRLTADLAATPAT